MDKKEIRKFRKERKKERKKEERRKIKEIIDTKEISKL